MLGALWWLSCLPEAARFQWAAGRARACQQGYLQKLWQRNQNCDYFRHHGLKRWQDFRERLPLVEYADLQEWIERCARGQSNVLCSEPIRLFEPTSGTQASKLIPYTTSLKAEFQRGLGAWIADLYAGKPTLMSGRAYWSITPPAQRPQRSAGGIPIGFEDDAAYLTGWSQSLVRGMLAVPKATDLDETITQLLHCADLKLVSVWSPTFWLLLLERLKNNWGRWARMPSLSERMVGGFRTIWPQLRLLSCWADGPSVRFLPALRADFPDLFIQPKGLLATEAFVTFPMLGRRGGALSLRSHFFEFLGIDGGLYLAHELVQGRSYEVVVSTGGGLYRYRLGDRVVVSSFYKDCPLLRFRGRSGIVSDHCGEKVGIEAIELWLPPRPGPCFVAFEEGGYVLYGEGDLHEAVRDGEESLLDYYNYKVCRELGQLRPLRGYQLEENAWEAFYSRMESLGRRRGEVKPLALRLEEDWSRHLPGRWV